MFSSERHEAFYFPQRNINHRTNLLSIGSEEKDSFLASAEQ